MLFGKRNRSGGICTSMQVGDILVQIDGESFSQAGLCTEFIKADTMDCAPDVLCFSFDAVSEEGQKLKQDVQIVCVAYAGEKKLNTQKKVLAAKAFQGRESVEIDFQKWGICDKADRITVRCESLFAG